MTNIDESPVTSSIQDSNVEGKRPYHTPQFVHHGDVADLVQNNEGVGGDGGGGFASDTLS